MSALTEEQQQQVERLIDQRLEALLKYGLRAFQPPETNKPVTIQTPQKPVETVKITPAQPVQQQTGGADKTVIQTVTWQQRPATSLGPYEATTDIVNPQIWDIVKKCEEEQRAVDLEGYRYWVMKDKQGVVVSLARRAK